MRLCYQLIVLATTHPMVNSRKDIAFFVVQSDIAEGMVSERPWLFELSMCQYVCLVS